jgi:hypothetical protein
LAIGAAGGVAAGDVRVNILGDSAARVSARSGGLGEAAGGAAGAAGGGTAT